MKRTSQQIKKRILEILSGGKTYTYAELERKINTGYRSIVANCQELKAFNAIKITKYDKHKANGKPYFLVEITAQGTKFLKNL